MIKNWNRRARKLCRSYHQAGEEETLDPGLLFGQGHGDPNAQRTPSNVTWLERKFRSKEDFLDKERLLFCPHTD